MKNSSITEPASYAKGHFSDGKPDDRKHFYRSNPAASLFTTAADYAGFCKHACMMILSNNIFSYLKFSYPVKIIKL